MGEIRYAGSQTRIGLAAHFYTFDPEHIRITNLTSESVLPALHKTPAWNPRGGACALIDEQAVRLRVDVLHRHLEAVECAGLRHLHFVGEVDRQVLVDDAVRSSKEGQHVLDEVLLVRIEFLPIFRWQTCRALPKS